MLFTREAITVAQWVAEIVISTSYVCVISHTLSLTPVAPFTNMD